MPLEDLGWNAEIARSFEPFAREGLIPGRLAAEHRAGWDALAASGELAATLAGRLRHEEARPAVGDWVALTDPVAARTTIAAILPRRTKLARNSAQAYASEQVLAANVDLVWLVTSLDRDLNPRRLERYLTMAWESGALPAIVLTKADAAFDIPGAIERVETVASGARIFVVSALTGSGIDALEAELVRGRTVALVGSSGVGKSTLVNRLLGEERQAVHQTLEDGRGQHTTTGRRLIGLASGACLIDTPGLRELSVWEGGRGIEDAFAEVTALAPGCRFRDCRHEVEPGCAVLAAVEAGTLAPERVQGFQKISRELARLERKKERRASSQESKKHRALERSLREFDFNED